MTRAALIVALLLVVAAMFGAGSSAAEGQAVFVPFVALTLRAAIVYFVVGRWAGGSSQRPDFAQLAVAPDFYHANAPRVVLRSPLGESGAFFQSF